MKQVAHAAPMIGASPESISRNRKLAEALIRRGTSAAPVQHWTQALARVAQAGNGALHRHFANKNEREGLAAGNQALAQALAGGSMQDAAQALMGNAYTAQAGQGMAINAIQGRETAARQERLAQIKAQNEAARQASMLDRQKQLADYNHGLGADDRALRREKTQAELRNLTQKNSQNEIINNMLLGPMGPTGQPGPAGTPSLQNQSFNGAPQPNPGVHLTAGDTPQGQAQPQERMVQTPAGMMPENQARKLGFALSMSGKGDAGRMFTDPINDQKLGKAASNENDKQQFNSINALSRLDEIAGSADERFLTIDNKLKNYGISWLDSIGPLRHMVSPEDRQELKEFTQFRRSAVDNMNRYIKEITGAQMSEAEANRLRKAVPDPERDGPTQFMAKLADAKKSTRLAIIRYSYLRKNGFRGSAEQASRQLPLSNMSNIVGDARQRAFQQINAQNPNLPEDQKNEAARHIMRQELGIIS